MQLKMKQDAGAEKKENLLISTLSVKFETVLFAFSQVTFFNRPNSLKF